MLVSQHLHPGRGDRGLEVQTVGLAVFRILDVLSYTSPSESSLNDILSFIAQIYQVK